jgi:hypothetical protein
VDGFIFFGSHRMRLRHATDILVAAGDQQDLLQINYRFSQANNKCAVGWCRIRPKTGVDADHNIVRALRTVALPPEFTRALHAAIAEQAAGPWKPGDFDAQVRSAHQSWPSTEQMLSRAIARTRGGA